MATFLELTQDLARESGTLSPSLITTTFTPTNPRIDKMVRWVQRAYLNIQNEQRDWLWMEGEFTSALVINQTRYDPEDDFGLTRFGDWVVDTDILRPVSIYDAAIGVDDEGQIKEIDYSLWYSKYGRGSTDANRPIEYAIDPAGLICIGPKPNKAYVIRGIYQKSPQLLEDDEDEPEMPSRFHDLIVYEAMKLLLLHDGQFNEKAFEALDLLEMRQALHRQQLPEVTIGGGSIA